jgi:DNA-binding LytR/AlgR family response regulator
MLDRLQSKGFVQVNRSSIIRCDAIDGLTRQGRNWVVDLKDGSHVRVARSHVTATRAALRIAPAIPAPSPSNSPQTVNFTIGI